MKSGSLAVLTAVLSVALIEQSRAELLVWTVTETRHVLRSETPANVSTAVQVRSARNQWVSFQILLRSDEPVKGIELIPGDLEGPGGVILGRAGARLYRQYQI